MLTFHAARRKVPIRGLSTDTALGRTVSMLKMMRKISAMRMAKRNTAKVPMMTKNSILPCVAGWMRLEASMVLGMVLGCVEYG